jgi:hypothetical protein
MNHKPQANLIIAECPDGAQSWDRHLGLSAVWGSICWFGNAISQQVRDIVLDLNELGHQHRQARARQHGDKCHQRS